MICTNKHSFDIARSGYCNLLQPQDRRSKEPGDSRDAVAARRQFLDAGHGAHFVTPMIEMTDGAQRILDVGCGEGHHLDALRVATNAEAHGVDISTPAIDLAARRYRDCFFVIANADRFVPYADASFDLITSITSRLNASEFRRVVAAGGRLLIALPGPDDLIELRAAILGEGKVIDRVDRTLETFRGGFELLRNERVRVTAQLDRDAIEQVMTSSYRGLRTRERERLAEIGAMQVTLARDLLLFRAI
ncbi:MAG: methyltransferase domain-containing protein [Thermoanaerobaculia bacterium]|nr:methyltransferase domain-containing protein [Thermoanaerobaculia bacterium]